MKKMNTLKKYSIVKLLSSCRNPGFWIVHDKTIIIRSPRGLPDLFLAFFFILVFPEHLARQSLLHSMLS